MVLDAAFLDMITLSISAQPRSKNYLLIRLLVQQITQLEWTNQEYYQLQQQSIHLQIAPLKICIYVRKKYLAKRI